MATSSVEKTLERLRVLITERSPDGDGRLPPETALSRQLGVGRSTLREALARLEAEGRIERRRGAGTRILWGPPKLRYPAHVILALSQFLRESGTTGIDYQVRAFHVRRVKADSRVATAMSLREGEEVFDVDRVYDIEGSPAAYLQHYLPTEIGGEPLKIEQMQDGAVTFLEEVQGVHVHDVDSAITAETATGAPAERLGVTSGAPLLAMYTTLYGEEGSVLALGRMMFRPEIVCLGVAATGEVEARPGPADGERG